jgi:hypothetical protein
MISTSRRAVRGRAERGQGTLEYLGAIAIAAVLVITVAVGVLAQDSGVRSAVDRAVCTMLTLGTGACGRDPVPEGGSDQDSLLCQMFGWGCAHQDDAGDDDKPWYCDLFGVGCPDDQSDDPPVDIPEGLNEGDELVTIMLSTERGRQTLQWLADNDVPIKIDPNVTGAFWNGTEIVLGPGYEDAAVLVHEANHARYTKEGRSADIEHQTKDDYVRSALDEEIAGTIQQIYAAREFRAAGHSAASSVSEQQYDAAYDQAIDEGKSTAEADRAGQAAVAQGFNDGTIKTSNTGQSYVDYYSQAWDQFH